MYRWLEQVQRQHLVSVGLAALLCFGHSRRVIPPADRPRTGLAPSNSPVGLAETLVVVVRQVHTATVGLVTAEWIAPVVEHLMAAVTAEPLLVLAVEMVARTETAIPVELARPT